jgi:hypothetical protein
MIQPGLQCKYLLGKHPKSPDAAGYRLFFNNANYASSQCALAICFAFTKHPCISLVSTAQQTRSEQILHFGFDTTRGK